MAQKADPKTGEIITISPKYQFPAEAAVTPVQKVSGKNILHINLRDHPELNDLHIVIAAAGFNMDGSPEYNSKPYCTLICWVWPKTREVDMVADLRSISTGAGNVFDRTLDAQNANAFPISGTLRKSGRAWFLD